MIDKPWQFQKSVRLKADSQWQPIKDLAVELANERGSSVSVPDAIMEAIKFYRENRPKLTAK